MFWRPTALPIVPFGGVDQGFSTMRVTSPYGPRDGGFHGGLDIGNYRAGDIVTAIGPGQVIMASPQPNIPWSYPSPRDMVATWGVSYGGNVIVIRHSDRWYSQYAHLAEMDVAQGDTVDTNQPIGKVGDTGSAKGQAHLHFGIRDSTQLANGHAGFVNPWPLLTASGDTLPNTALEDDMIDANRFRPIGSVVFRGGVIYLNADRAQGVVTTLTAPTRLQVYALPRSATENGKASLVPVFITPGGKPAVGGVGYDQMDATTWQPLAWTETDTAALEARVASLQTQLATTQGAYKTLWTEAATHSSNISLGEATWLAHLDKVK